MGPTNSRPAELALPVASMAALRRALAGAVGADAAARALQSAGHAAGDGFYRALCRQPGPGAPAIPDEAAPDALRELGEDAFWRRFHQLFASRGWGTLVHETPHPGVGALGAADWVEADPAAEGSRPACFFTTGLLANLLGQIAGQEIAVLEIECRSRGDERCRFLFGGPEAVTAVFQRLQDGETADASLSVLA